MLTLATDSRSHVVRTVSEVGTMIEANLPSGAEEEGVGGKSIVRAASRRDGGREGFWGERFEWSEFVAEDRG